jgi:hypothetical protein
MTEKKRKSLAVLADKPLPFLPFLLFFDRVPGRDTVIEQVAVQLPLGLGESLVAVAASGVSLR